MADPACEKRKFKIIHDCPEDCPKNKGCNVMGVTNLVAEMEKLAPKISIESRVSVTFIKHSTENTEVLQIS